MSNHPWASTPDELTLPSGLTVKLKPVRVQALVRAGAFGPDELAVLSGESGGAVENFRVMAIAAERSLLEPRVTLDPKKVNEKRGIYSVDAIPDEDLLVIFRYVKGEDLAAFRGEPDGAGGSEGGTVLADDAQRDDAPVAA